MKGISMCVGSTIIIFCEREINIKEIYDVVVIGNGPGGLNAALYASRSNLSTLIIGAGMPGGQLNDTSTVDNYLGAGETTGPELAMEMFEDTTRYGAEYEFDKVSDIEDAGEYKEVHTDTTSYKAKTVIVAVGTQYRGLGIPGEEKLRGRGVSWCYTCDGAFFKDKPIAIIGGGDSAVEGAEYLTQFSDEVYLIHRRDELRAQPVIQDKAFDNGKITFLWDSEVDVINGEDTVKGITINYKGNTPETYEIPAEGVFVSIGSEPQTDFLDNLKLSKDGEGYINVNSKMETNVPGVYAVGDVTSTPLRQVATAIGDGAIAGNEVYKYLK